MGGENTPQNTSKEVFTRTGRPTTFVTTVCYFLIQGFRFRNALPETREGFLFLDSWGVAHSAPPGFHSYSSGAKCALRGIRSIPRPDRLTQTAGPPTHQVNQARSEWAEPLSRECFSTLSAGFPQVQRNHPPGFFVAPRTNSSHDSAILKSAHWLYCKPDKHAFPSTSPRIAAHGYLSSRAINL